MTSSRTHIKLVHRNPSIVSVPIEHNWMAPAGEIPARILAIEFGPDVPIPKLLAIPEKDTRTDVNPTELTRQYGSNILSEKSQQDRVLLLRKYGVRAVMLDAEEGDTEVRIRPQDYLLAEHILKSTVPKVQLLPFPIRGDIDYSAMTLEYGSSIIRDENQLERIQQLYDAGIYAKMDFTDDYRIATHVLINPNDWEWATDVVETARPKVEIPQELFIPSDDTHFDMIIMSQIIRYEIQLETIKLLGENDIPAKMRYTSKYRNATEVVTPQRNAEKARNIIRKGK